MKQPRIQNNNIRKAKEIETDLLNLAKMGFKCSNDLAARMTVHANLLNFWKERTTRGV